MIIDLLLLIVSLIALAAGAEGLVKGSKSIALRLGMTPMMAGLTIVAFGTSAPELVVSLTATLNDQASIAVGNVVGSNIINIALILGLTALIFPITVHINLLKYDAVIMVLASLVLALLLTFGGVPRWAGIFFLSGLVLYNLFVIRMAKAEALNQKLPASEQVEHPDLDTRKSLLYLAGGLALLVVASNMLVDSAVNIARAFEVSEAIIGLTIVAAGTSMPELAASVAAAIRKQPDIAVGNIIGSNLFNILAILGVCATTRPIMDTGITPFDIWVMVGFAAVILPMMYTHMAIKRHEGGLLLAGYGIYLFLMWPA